jgi:hypothetical protein
MMEGDNEEVEIKTGEKKEVNYKI